MGDSVFVQTNVDPHCADASSAPVKCASCSRGAIELYDDGSAVLLRSSAGGAHELGSWGALTLHFEDADGKGYDRKYVAEDTPLVMGWVGVDEIPEGVRALFWHPLWIGPAVGKRVGGQMVWLDGYDHHTLARRGMLIPDPALLKGAPPSSASQIVGDSSRDESQ